MAVLRTEVVHDSNTLRRLLQEVLHRGSIMKYTFEVGSNALSHNIRCSTNIYAVSFGVTRRVTQNNPNPQPLTNHRTSQPPPLFPQLALTHSMPSEWIECGRHGARVTRHAHRGRGDRHVQKAGSGREQPPETLPSHEHTHATGLQEQLSEPTLQARVLSLTLLICA